MSMITLNCYGFFACQHKNVLTLKCYMKFYMKLVIMYDTLGQKKNVCVFQVSRPYLVFCPDPKHFIVNCEQNVVKLRKKGEKCIEKSNFYIKYFDKIKCYADRPYLVFSELKPETHIYIFLALCIILYISVKMKKDKIIENC